MLARVVQATQLAQSPWTTLRATPWCCPTLDIDKQIARWRIARARADRILAGLAERRQETQEIWGGSL